MQTEHKLIVIIGTSGVGKTTLADALADRFQIPSVVTCTTRPKRAGERDGVDYHFLTRSQFQGQELIESTSYDGHFYGSSLDGIRAQWERHPILSVVLDYHGAVAYQRKLGDQCLFLHLTATEPELVGRLTKRGMPKADIESRLQSTNTDIPKHNPLRSLYEVPTENWWREFGTVAELVCKLDAQTTSKAKTDV